VTAGDNVALSGAVSHKKAGMPVHLEIGNGTTFTDSGQSSTTDAAGSFALTYKTSTAGPMSFRVSITDGSKAIQSGDVTVGVLSTTGVVAAIQGGDDEVGVGSKASVAGKVTPAKAGRSVALQTSSGGGQWTTTKSSTKTDSTGGFTLPFPTSASGKIAVRVIAAASDTAAEGVSAGVSLHVADYKAAGAKYVACVKDWNAAVDAQSKAIDQLNAGSIDLSALQKTDAALADAGRREISCMTSYAWPPSADALVKDLNAQTAVIVDTEVRVSKAQSTDAYTSIATETSTSTAEDAASADAAKIRRALDLPARS
jgi:hypothetical protein